MYYSFLFVILIFSCTDMLHKPIYSGLGEAERVAPLIVSTNLVEYNSSFSPDGRELFFTRNNEQWSAPQLMKAVLKDGRYQSAEQLTIENVSGDYGDFHLSADGRFLFFSFSKTGKRADIWRAERSGQSWKNAAVLPASVNSDADEFYPTATTDGKLVFASNRSGNMDIYMSDYRDGNYLPALRLPEAINSTGFEGDPMIARDASFIIFVKMNAPDGLGMSDLYISFYENGKWRTASNLGSKINSNAVDGSPCLSPDGRFLFLTSNRGSENVQRFDGKLDIFMIPFSPDKYR